jgi:tRNA G46 methylase TrmB
VLWLISIALFLTYSSPKSPDDMDWSSYFPHYVQEGTPEDPSKPPKLTKDVEIVDIGCGFGGLLVALAPKLPDTLTLGK